ncbi:MAG: hypothetical protein JWN38_1041 [Candidatus Saccharibacteria bacterium]|nr:hypothetical protein [Candidatus Saccharibacteria bacterium]
MIADLLPHYYEHYRSDVQYDVLRSIVIDGHETAWMSFVGSGREGEPFTGRELKCECDFTEGVGWQIHDKFGAVGLDGGRKCLKRQAALRLRHLELREEYAERFLNQPEKFGMFSSCIREITLDLIEKGQAGEWLEDGGGAAFYGGYFYLQTLAAITDIYMGHLWEDMYALLEEKLIEIDGAVVKSYTKPPPPKWEEFARIEQDGWIGIAKLPGHRRMAQEWKFEVLNPAGKSAIHSPGKRLLHDPIFGPDVEDVARAEEQLKNLIQVCREYAEK